MGDIRLAAPAHLSVMGLLGKEVGSLLPGTPDLNRDTRQDERPARREQDSQEALRVRHAAAAWYDMAGAPSRAAQRLTSPGMVEGPGTSEALRRRVIGERRRDLAAALFAPPATDDEDDLDLGDDDFDVPSFLQ